MRIERDHAGKIPIGCLPHGPLNAITDVPGVRVGHCTLIHDTPSIARTGVTAILPTEADYTDISVFAGFHRYNGFGEVTGVHWIEETGVLTSPIVTTSTFSLGVARDALLADPMRRGIPQRFHHPVVGETNDLWLNDGLAAPIEAKHVLAAVAAAAGGDVAEGNVGGGTGMIAYMLKGGIGSASRLAKTKCGAFTVGVLVQANHGMRDELVVEGVPVGRFLEGHPDEPSALPSEGSIIVVVATDAPLLPSQCNRLAQRAVAGLARVGCNGNNSSGDFIIAFATGNRFPACTGAVHGNLRMMSNDHITPLFHAAIEAVEAAVVNAVVAAETMRGRDGHIVHALERAHLEEIMRHWRRSGHNAR